MAHQGDFGGNPLGHFTQPPFPSPATIGGAQASHQAPFQANPSAEPFITGAGMPWSGYPGANNALAAAPPAVAPPPQAFQPDMSHHPYWTMPHAPNTIPFQHFAAGGAAAQQPPLHGEDLAARVAAMNANILASQSFQPNNYTHGWPQQQAPLYNYNPAPQPAGNIAAPPPVGPNGAYGGATCWAPPMPHPAWPTPPMQQPGGDTSWVAPMQQQQMVNWAPPAQQQPGGEMMSWAPQEQRPGVFPGGSASAHQAQAPVRAKTFEEFLMDAGVLDDGSVDEILVGDLMKDLMRDEGSAESGPVQPPPPAAAAGSYSGPGRDQVGLYEEPAGSGRDSEAATEARARRGRRMAKRKEALARARPGN